jgi:hypothetical protein
MKLRPEDMALYKHFYYLRVAHPCALSPALRISSTEPPRLNLTFPALHISHIESFVYLAKSVK